LRPDDELNAFNASRDRKVTQRKQKLRTAPKLSHCKPTRKFAECRKHEEH